MGWNMRFCVGKINLELTLPDLCVRGWPVHVGSARNREKRLSDGSKSAPSCNVAILSSMSILPKVQRRRTLIYDYCKSVIFGLE